MFKPRIIIIGAGPAGLGAAYKLSRENLARVTVIEKSENIGGMAGSFELAGIQVDYGSHRLHPSCDPEILQDIKDLLGNDLLELPRLGRIRLCGQWIRFPLRLQDLAFRLPLRFSFGVASDLLAKAFAGRPRTREETFASVLEKGLGRTIFNQFYAPYAKKIWGVPPEQLSAGLANRRVSARSLQKMVKKVLSGVSIYYHPRQGFGQISQRLFEAAKKAGTEFFLGARIRSLSMAGDRVTAVSFDRGDELPHFQPDQVWSTIPLAELLAYVEPAVPYSLIQASSQIEYRAMILVYLLLEQDRFSEYDAHYFPETDIPITRLSEPKNYNGAREPKNMTVLCAEIPCALSDKQWNMSAEELGELVGQALESAGLPLKNPVKGIFIRRLENAYPIYRSDYRNYFDQIDQWLGRVSNLLSFGRHGLFAHDNVHHAFSMGYAAVKCLDRNGELNRRRWGDFRRVFDSYVVED